MIAHEIASIDFETYSEAGYLFDAAAGKWKPITKSPPHGLPAVGASAYTEHPSCEVLSLAYDLKRGAGPKLWTPDKPPPLDLFAYVAGGGLISAWNSMFEFLVWSNVCVPKLLWPPLPLAQLRDPSARSRAWSAPGKLSEAGKALRADELKIEDGTRLLNKFSKPRNPTKNNPSRRTLPADDPPDALRLYQYNLQDIKTEADISRRLPELLPHELPLWLVDQEINARGCAIDMDAVRGCITILHGLENKLNAEVSTLTCGALPDTNKLKKLKAWCIEQGVAVDSLDADAVITLLERKDLPAHVRRVIEVRSILGAASVKKLLAIARRVSKNGRLCDMFAFCGADRTGRWAGRGPQPQNLPNSGPEVRRCDCNRYYGAGKNFCPHCGITSIFSTIKPWCLGAVEDAIEVLSTGSLALAEMTFDDPIAVISGCLRGSFVADEGHDLVSSDYSAIEAVVLAFVAGEQWRMDVFNTHGMIYEMSASKISGVPFQEFIDHRETTGEHHPLRKKIGKVAELASGYQGWIGAWKQFGADKHIGSDEEIKEAIIKWRNASPAIVALWKGLEAAATNAILSPGTVHTYRGIPYTFPVGEGILYCTLPSGRRLAYHEPRATYSLDRYGRKRIQLSYMGFNTDYKKGPRGWMRLDTYGGKLTENYVQAVSRDILAHAIVNLEAAGYKIVLHIHDEAVAEVPIGFGSVEEFERIMATLPTWCADWPIRASGGWRGKRYRKG